MVRVRVIERLFFCCFLGLSVDETGNCGCELVGALLWKSGGVGGVCAFRYKFASDEGASLRGSREGCLDGVHLKCGEVESFVECGAGSSEGCVEVASDVSPFVFDEAWARGSGETDES